MSKGPRGRADEPSRGLLTTRHSELAEAVHGKLDLARYDWLTEQLSLLEDPKRKLWKVVKIIVETEGNPSERRGTAFGMCPSWAWEKAERIVEVAKTARLKFLQRIDSLLEQEE